MPDADDVEPWSPIAAEWARLWAASARPAQSALLAASGVGPGSRVLDVGCGSGELLRLLGGIGAEAAGVDPAAGMVGLARATAPEAAIRVGGWEHLPWPDASFDVVTAVNSLQFADDPGDALVEAARVLVPGGAIAIANWAEAALSDLDAIEAAVARAHDEDPGDDPDYRRDGGLERLLAASGWATTASGLVDVPWRARDDDELVRAVLLGEDAEGLTAGASVVIEAARPFRDVDGGGYTLLNRFRWAVAVRP